MDWVLDSSLALAWALPDENSGQAEEIFFSVADGDLFYVPSLWWYEISNALIVAQRRERINEADRNRMIELYGMLPIQTDTLFHADMIRRFQELAQEHHLSAYDAAYLELAQRKGLGLATLDNRLRNAAEKAGVKTNSP